MGTGVPPSHSIVTQIATAERIAPIDLETPLHDVIDPDALDRLIASSDHGSSVDTVVVEFTYYGYTVQVNGAGAVEIRPAEQTTDSNSGVDSTEDAHGD
ncbi:HalOD1 output domain-containing protein [Natronorubrum halophilum]|uniref:HalOD1 output domain-containing protein n=1 Tax=Natronorubrum halophilum TaxID=1702106 RepID=UPI000EF6986F|nr:HalOD1 output domain-containing protein [Natronorubrum halophilum]